MEQSGRRSVNQFKLKPQACADGLFKGYYKLDGINSVAMRDKAQVFRNLIHHVNEDNLIQAFRGLDGSKAVGIDQVTKSEYSQNLRTNIELLSDKIRKGGWRPRPTREVLNRRSQKISFSWEQFKRKLMFNPLPKPPLGYEPVDITSEYGTKLKHKTKSRVRKLRTHGSERSNGRQRPLFT